MGASVSEGGGAGQYRKCKGEWREALRQGSTERHGEGRGAGVGVWVRVGGGAGKHRKCKGGWGAQRQGKRCGKCATEDEGWMGAQSKCRRRHGG